MFFYHAFGLHIQSALALPELLPCDNTKHIIPDILIALGDVSEHGLENITARGAFYQADDNALWLSVPGVARYLVRDGCRIIIEPMPLVDEDSIRLFLLGSCMGALLMQRELFLLHANAIKVGDACISFSGRSGAGKSTLSGAFMRRGYSVLADDVCAINSDGEVLPSFPQIKLWADTSKKLAVETHTLRRVRPQHEKFSVPLASQFYTKQLPLKVMYVLSAHNLDTFSFQPVEGVQKALPLKNNTYRYPYVKGLGKSKLHLKHVGELASRVSIVRIMRPKAGFRLDELVGLVEADLSERGMQRV
ncbi:MAG: hypothetical protein P1U32_07100 [Legionellaceae bacterium]|nr:hypothetical protein [Legionellaceae bacterium]